jgi:hypothetical protein
MRNLYTTSGLRVKKYNCRFLHSPFAALRVGRNDKVFSIPEILLLAQFDERCALATLVLGGFRDCGYMGM